MRRLLRRHGCGGGEDLSHIEFEGQRTKIRFLNPDLGLINTHDPTALDISAYGPRARALTAKLQAGWVNFVGDPNSDIDALEQMRAAWTKAGNTTPLSAVTFALDGILQDGEPYDSPRAMAQADPRAAVLLHRAADEALAGPPNTSKIPDSVADAVAAYVDLAMTFKPVDAKYLINDCGPLVFVKPKAKKYVTGELIRANIFTAPEAIIQDRIAALHDAGYTLFTVQLVLGQEHAIEDGARIMRAFRYRPRTAKLRPINCRCT